MTFCVRLPRIGTFNAWRGVARQLARAGVPAGDVDWGIAGEPTGLFDDALPDGAGALSVPGAFVDLAAALTPERSGEGMAIAYALLLRLQGSPRLLGNRADRLVARARQIGKTTRRDIHKMKAFVRFRELPSETARRRFAAWFEPCHRIEEPAATFFADRFGDMDWLIQTPEITILFEEGRLWLTAERNTRPAIDDDIEQLWKTYYAHVFNPARLKVKAMQAEMPKKYWRNLPEAVLIPELIASADLRATEMRQTLPSQAPPRAARILDRLHAPNQKRTPPAGRRR